jgi:hypothetical protein
MHRRLHLVALGALVLATASPALADAPEYTEAKQRMREGKALYDRGQFELARLKYSQACAVMRSFSCVRSLGMSEFRTGHFVEAYQHLSETLRDPTADKLPADLRKTVETMKQGAYEATGHLEITAPAGATLLVDGEAAGTAPLAEALTVTAGRHALDAKNPDGTGQHAVVDAVAAKSVAVDLRPVVPAATVPPVAGTSVAPPPPSSPAAAGAASVPDGPPPEVHASFWTTPRVVGTVMAGAGVASLVAGGLFAASAQSDANSVSSLQASLGNSPSACAGGSAPSACQGLQSERDAQSRDHALNLAFTVGGIAALGVGAVLFFWPSGGGGGGHVAVAPAVGAHDGAVWVRGEF